MNWKEQIRDWWYKYHDGGYEMPEQMRVDIERIFKHSQQQLLESLSEEIDGMYEKCPCGKFNCHGQGNDDALNEVKALIQSKKESLMGL